MVVSEQFPLFRLATLLARQLSSPIATRIKEYAKSHPRFGRSVCMRSGRVAAAAELRFKLWTLRVRPKHGVSAPPVLTDRLALDAGADLLGEIIIFILGAAIVTFEYNRQAMKQEAKVAAERSAWVAASLQAEELRRELEQQQRDLERLARLLRTLAPTSLQQDITRVFTPPERDPTEASTPSVRDPTRASAPSLQDPTRTSTPTERDLTRASAPPEQDPNFSSSTPSVRDPTQASTPPEQDPTLSSTAPEQDPTRASHGLCACPEPPIVCGKK